MQPDKDTVRPDNESRQLELYARDLQALYWRERKKRAELAEERLVLEYKLHELEALNRLFQANLEEMTQAREAYNDLRAKLARLLSGNGDLRERLEKLLSQMDAKQSTTDNGRSVK